jgi:thiamine biosynthesis lipoprotein
MGTLVTIEVVERAGGHPRSECEAAVERGFDWFREIERTCTRFDPSSELMTLSRTIGVPVPASPILFEALRFGLAMAADTSGAFDPTMGLRMEALGFNREHRSGREVRTPIEAVDAVSYLDVLLDESARTITLRRPLVLDLGAIAKGLAVDMAVVELAPLADFAIDAGGDLYLGGHNAHGRPWSIGIRHPRDPEQLIESLTVSNRAVCTSGDYERQSQADPRAHHILDPATGQSAREVVSATVVGPSAMLADALATAAFVSGPLAGIQLLERHGVEGMLVTANLAQHTTPGFTRNVQQVTE